MWVDESSLCLISYFLMILLYFTGCSGIVENLDTSLYLSNEKLDVGKLGRFSLVCFLLLVKRRIAYFLE